MEKLSGFSPASGTNEHKSADSGLHAPLQRTFHSTGYDREEEYFHRVNQEAIAALHPEAATTPSVCPACGSSLEAQEHLGMSGHLCGQCGGVFLTRPQLETLADSSHPVWVGVKRFLQKLVKPLPSGIGQFPV